MRAAFIFGLLSAVTLCTSQPFGQTAQADTYSIDPADIVDWNTDGKELSMCLSDGSECYAYKKDECFNAKNVLIWLWMILQMYGS